MNISPSKAQNIIKRFREFREMSVHMGQGQKCYWVSVIFGPSVGTEFKTGMKSLTSGTLPEITVCKHSMP